MTDFLSAVFIPISAKSVEIRKKDSGFFLSVKNCNQILNTRPFSIKIKTELYGGKPAGHENRVFIANFWFSSVSAFSVESSFNFHKILFFPI